MVGDPINEAVTSADNSTTKFLEKLKKTNLDIIYGKGDFHPNAVTNIDFSDPKQREKFVKRGNNILKNPSITSMTNTLKALNSYDLCNPFTFATSQLFPSDGRQAGQLRTLQGIVSRVFETFRNFSIIPGNVTVGDVISPPDPLSDADFGGFTFTPDQKVLITVPENNPTLANDTVLFIRQTEDPTVSTFATATVLQSFEATGDDFGRVFRENTSIGRTYQVQIERISTVDPPYQKNRTGNTIVDENGKPIPRVFTTFEIEFEKVATTNLRETSEELQGIAIALSEIGYNEILNDLNEIPNVLPGVAKFKENARKVGDFINQVGLEAATISDTTGDAAEFLAGGLTTDQVLQGSAIFQDFYQKARPFINFQSSLASIYKRNVEAVNNTLRNAIPYDELAKFVQIVTNFARVVNGIVSFILVLLKTVNKIVKILTVILKTLKIIIKVIRKVIKAIPAAVVPVGAIETVTSKLNQIDGAIGKALKFLQKISDFLDAFIKEVTLLKNALLTLIEQGGLLAAKLDSCNGLKSSGLGSAMENMVSQVRNSLRDLTGVQPGEDYYPDDPNAPGGGLTNAQAAAANGTNSYIRLPNGELIFVNDSIFGFDVNGNLIFYGDLVSLATGVSFEDSLGQQFRNSKLQYYTFDKFRNNQRNLLEAADQLAFDRLNRVQAVDPEDIFGNFAEVYLGYTIKIQEEKPTNPNSQVAIRRRGIALDQNEKIVVSTELTFSTNLATIVQETKFLIRRNVELGIIGVNTADTLSNDPTDNEAIALAESTGANPLAISNIKAEANNKAAASARPTPLTEDEKNVQTRIGNRPFTPLDTGGVGSNQLPDGSSNRKPVVVEDFTNDSFNQFIDSNPSLKNITENLSLLNRATPTQLSNILNTPGAEELNEDELVAKLKESILSEVDPNPEKVDQVTSKTEAWYEGLREQARTDWEQLTREAFQRKIPAPSFEEYFTKVETAELPKWIKLLLRSGYTETEVEYGISQDDIRDKYRINIDEKGKVEVNLRRIFRKK